ncbi:MAG: ribonuclease H-like domain-containing protein [Methanolinea sp.]|nr:ribonuclease H-like domain-containing protein [Methanolinea sp.]
MTLPLVFETASRLWRDRVSGSRDYSVIQNDRFHRAFLSHSPVLESEYRETIRLKSALLRLYEDRSLEEVFPGDCISTPEGEVYCIRRDHPLRLPVGDHPDVRGQLLSDLTLVYGIGRQTARHLKRRGYRTIADLLSHRRFGARARECLHVLTEGSPADVLALVSRWYPPSHPRYTSSARLFAEEDFLFLDLETLGIFQRPIILVGLASLKDQKLVTEQFLVREMAEELPALLATIERFSAGRVLVTYNGRSFDVPYLRERCALYGEEFSAPAVHYDLLHPARQRYSATFSDCRLCTLERGLFGITRGLDVPSLMVPEFYEAYVTHANPGPLVPVVEHNCQDLVSLARLFSCFLEET